MRNYIGTTSEEEREGEQAWLASVLPAQADLDRELGNDPVAALLGLAKSRAPIEFGFTGPLASDDPELKKQFEVARQAAAALKQSPLTVLSSEQVTAMHAFVHLLARPALRVVDNAVPAIPSSWPKLKVAHDNVIETIRGIGRVDQADRSHVGTGWFVAENMLLTNRHVAGALCGLDVHNDHAWLDKLPAARAATNTAWAADTKLRAVWDPAEAPSAASTAVGSITKIRAVHEYLDMALLDVTGVANSKKLVLRMHASGPASTKKHDVYVAGYPGVRPPHGVSVQAAKLLFPDAIASGLKRVSPGQLVALVADLPIASDKPRQSHDASTLGGNSGSPVIDFANHRVVAIHYSGAYGMANYAVPLWLVKDDPFFADHGVTLAS